MPEGVELEPGNDNPCGDSFVEPVVDVAGLEREGFVSINGSGSYDEYQAADQIVVFTPDHGVGYYEAFDVTEEPVTLLAVTAGGPCRFNIAGSRGNDTAFVAGVSY